MAAYGIVFPKRCPHCKQHKPKEAFYRYARGYSSWCRSCHRAWAIERKRRLRGTPKARFTLTPLARRAYDSWHAAYKAGTYGGKPFTLTREWVEERFREFCETHYHQLEAGPFCPSLDRLDPKKGYTEDNVRVVWRIENLARNRFTDAQVIEFCKRKLGLL